MPADHPDPSPASPRRGPWARLRHEATLAAVALQFLTRVPVRLQRYDPEWLHGSARHFPLVGLGVGGFGAAVLGLALCAWGPLVAVLLSLAATVWATGGFHEDGLADTCDGLGGAVSRERALAIMKDSRLGSYGALGLGLTLALKVAALTALAERSGLLAGAALVLAHGWSRGATVALLRALPYAGDVEHAKAKPLAQRVGDGALLVALAWCALGAAAVWAALPWLQAWAAPLALAPGGGAMGAGLGAGFGAGFGAGLGPAHAAPLVLAGPLALPVVAAGWAARLRPWLIALGAVALVATVCARWLRRRLGGYTGDGLGATQQWTELAVYLALAAQA